MNDRSTLLILSAAGGAIIAISIVELFWGWIGISGDPTIIKIIVAIVGAGVSFRYLSLRVKRTVQGGGG